MSINLSSLNPLGYTGTNVGNPTPLMRLNRAPTPNDALNVTLGQLWLNTATNILYYLANLNEGIALWNEITPIVVINRAPLTSDATNYIIGQFWLDTSASVLYFLASVTAGVATWVNVLSGNGTDGQLLIGGGTLPTWANITSNGGSIAITNGPNSINIDVAPSSLRFKENIKEMNSHSELVYKLRPVTFFYKDDESKTKQFGLIAEEVNEVFPELVFYDDKGKALGVKYHELPSILLNEIQKQQKTIKEQTKTISNLVDQIQAIQEKLIDLQSV